MKIKYFFIIKIKIIFILYRLLTKMESSIKKINIKYAIFVLMNLFIKKI
jgi:hypothetical protein